LIIYNGYLSEADRLAVTSYLEQKYFQAGSSGSLAYQWQFDGTNIANATNATLTLTDVQITNDGVYTVAVSNLIGVTISSNAVLAVGYAPSITAQPQSREVVQGTNVSFTVTATGTSPLSYQWCFDGAALAQGTNATLALTNVQGTNSGSYSVIVSSPFGSVLSSNAVLTVDLLPIIVTQPQSQTVLVGTNVTFSVTATATSPALPVINSGTLRLWLKADAGVLANSAGLVSQWQDQSGNSNNAVQANTNQQPTLVAAVGLGGKPAIRFNGIQDNVNGSFLFGSGNVGVPNAMTEFTVYNAFSTATTDIMRSLIGVPGNNKCCRCDDINSGEMLFVTWNDDYRDPFVVPTNTYRIWTDRLNTNLTTLDMFDATALGSNSFTTSVTGLIAPGAGYYVGGLNVSLSGVGTSRCFDGDVAEYIVYQGYLSEADRLAVTSYLEQKYYQSVSSGNLAYQWQFNGTNIANATNATLTLTNVQITNDGVYTVTVSNVVGVTTSSNAVLAVGYAPSITAQPQSQEVVQGTNVSFTVTATGTSPLSYQWCFDGAALAQGTNPTLTLTNVQGTNSGTYSVVVSSPFGLVLSSNAVLTVDLLPIIITQPQSQTVLVGTNVTFSVAASGGGSSPVLPAVGSGTLKLWLKADSGVVTNSAGLVSQWQDQSGNSNNAVQATTNNQPLLVSALGLGGKPAVRFNGIQDNVNGSYLFGSGNVGVPNAMTAFTVYNAFCTTNVENLLWLVGVPGVTYGGVRCDDIVYQQMWFSTWYYNYPTSSIIPTNTYRIWTDRLNTNLTTLDIFDASAGSSTNFSFAIANAVVPAAGYYVGGLNPSLRYVATSRCFDGDVVELIIYNGYLSEADRLAVTSYLEQKYFQAGSSGSLAYQWQFDGTNIANATNATLTLTDVQITNDGVYTVAVSSGVASTTSSNALLAVGWPPTIVMQPASQSVELNCSATFNVSARGVAPLCYQWWNNGLPLGAQTNSSLAIANVQASNYGSYCVVVTNALGATISTVAVLAQASPPVANPDTVLRFAEGGVRLNAADLTTNDTVAVYDKLTVIAVSSNSIAGGNVSLNGPWIYYAPPAGVAASDIFTYTVSDGHCGTVTGTVTVQVQADNPQPENFAIGRMRDGSLQLTFDGIPGETYGIDYSDSLSPPNWQMLTNQTADSFGVIEITDWPLTNAPARFYRAVGP
jgi:hypothetical protein